MNNSFVFHRRLDRTLPTAVTAKGVWITDQEGRQYLDASGGPICVNVGHGRREVVEAMAAQAGRVDYIHGPHVYHRNGGNPCGTSQFSCATIH